MNVDSSLRLVGSSLLMIQSQEMMKRCESKIIKLVSHHLSSNLTDFLAQKYNFK